MNWARLQGVADKLIKKYGRNAILRRAAGDRPCTVVEIQFDPREQRGQLSDLIHRTILVSAVDLVLAPEMSKDTLITLVPGGTVEDEVLKIVAPPTRLAPGGIVVYWELNVRA